MTVHLRFWIFYFYNQPKTMRSWVNMERLERVRRDDTLDSKMQMNTWRRELGIRVHAARKARMRRLSYEWLAGLREIVIDPDRCPLTFSEFTLKEFERDKEGNRIDDIPDGNDHSIDAVRYTMMDDVLRG
jgi:phage terminase large subunit